MKVMQGFCYRNDGADYFNNFLASPVRRRRSMIYAESKNKSASG